MQISKSDYMLFLKHPAWLWAKKHDRDKIPAVDENMQAIFDAGHQFEPYAEALFPGGAVLGFSDFSEYTTLPQRTQDAIARGDKILFQPRFSWQDFTCICDIVVFVDERTVDLYEIKASTRVKPEHVFDLAFQAAVLEGSGLIIRKISVIHANNQYVRHGEIKPEAITAITDITEEVRAKGEETRAAMVKALAVAQSSTMPDPDPALAKLGSKKEWMAIYENITGAAQNTPRSDVKPTIDHLAIRKFLDSFMYPLYFFDYETMQSLLPYFDGHRVYQQVPFQYSLHVLRSPDAELEHLEYLHRENSNPIRPLTEKLLEHVGDQGTVLVWYQDFEKSRNTELGEMLPEYKTAMEALNARVVDLMTPFDKKQGWYDDPRFEGSASIKQVLPVLVPKLSYKELGIQEGASAQRLWMEAVLDGKRLDQRQAILDDLIKYCCLDTLAMVEIYRVLKRLSRD